MTKDELIELINHTVYENEDGDITGEVMNLVLNAIVATIGVEANPDDEATGTLNKIKIGEEVFDVEGGGGTVDPYPTEGSTNPVQSGGVYEVLATMFANGCLYGGLVEPNDQPTHGDDHRYFYLAATEGRYTHFNNYEVDSYIVMFSWNESTQNWRMLTLWHNDQTVTEWLENKANIVYNSTAGHLAGLDSDGNLTDSGIAASDVATTSDLADKLDAPSTAGTSGQVLTSDGQGGQSWQTPQSGVSSYNDLSDKPQINSVTLSGNKSASDLGLSTAAQGVKADTAYQKPQSGIPSTDLASGVQTSLGKADTAVQQVTVGTTTTGEAGTNASVTNSGTATNPVLDFTIPRGADGADAVNPFKGWYASANTLPANPVVGDYAYVKGANASDPIAIYECTTAGIWSDSGRTADTSNVQTFASNQEVNEVHIINDLTTGGVDDVLSAEQGKILKQEVSQLEHEVTDLQSDVSRLMGDVYDTEEIVLVGSDADKKVINSSGVVASISGTNYHVVTFDVSSLQGQTVLVTANTNWGNCIYAIYDGNGVLLAKSDAAPSSGTKFGIEDEEITLPNDAVTLYVAYNVSWENASVKYKNSTSKIDELENIVSLIPTEYKYVNGVENVISGKFISSAGVISNAGETYTISNNVLVEAGTTIYVTASSNWGNALYAFYAGDDSLVQVGQLAASSGTITEIEDYAVTVPNGASYIVVARNTSSLKHIAVKIKDGIQLKKQYGGKKWVVVGDSLTEENSTTTKHYFDYVAEKTGISTINMGVGGTGYMRGKDTSKAFYQRISSIDQTADVVTIFGSFNDLNYPALGFNSMEEALGNYDDDTDATISGCINLTIKNLQSAIPLVRLGIVAPCPWASTRPFQNQALMYVDRLKKIAEYHSIPFLDLWRGSNLRPWDADFRALAYTKDNGQDGNPAGTHPDETGHAILAPKFEAFLGELLL